ncbi:MAG TPA: hypothetical protein VFG39_05100 [Balneolaceae bacterium]|nr:hypothetical protein [Balneolaceae bacterium]
MGKKRSIFLLIGFGLLMTLASCELLGIGGGDEIDDKKEELPKPELMWKNSFFSELNGPDPIIGDSSVYVAGSYGLRRFSAVDGEGVWASSFDIPTKVVTMLYDEENLYLRCEHSIRAYSKADWNAVMEYSY